MTHLVLAYDVVKDRRRTRLRKGLVAWFPSVQKSVFEGPVPEKDHRKVYEAVRRNIDPRTDTVRVYLLCATCRDRTVLFGTAGRVDPEGEDVVVG